uniref:Uncharacterized protein n=1 Tax=Ditylenchus dipsaci TaxID=166011 RepID=A0A915D696_9BILA
MESSQMINRPRRLIRVTRKVIVKSTTLDQATTSYAYSNQRYRVITSQQSHNSPYSQPQYVVYSSYPEQQYVPYMSAPVKAAPIRFVYTSAPKMIARKAPIQKNLTRGLRKNSGGLNNKLGSPPVLTPENSLPNEMKLDAVRFDRSPYLTKNQENVATENLPVDEHSSLNKEEEEIEKRCEEPRNESMDKSTIDQHPNAPDMEALFDQIPLGKTIGHNWTDLLQFLSEEGFYSSDVNTLIS